MSPNTRPSRVLRLDRLGRDFGSTSVLKELSLEIQSGEFVALLGPSGCGKSTALNCVAGLLPATRGSVWLDDKRIDTLPPEDRGFGMVFQNYALFPHMTVAANVGFGLRMRRMAKTEIEQRVKQAIATVRLTGQEHKLPAQLSGGQQQRVAIARAIAVEPPVVLMDEPLSNLDAKLRLEMRQEIRRIHSFLRAITVYVTHDQEEALSLADRVVVLRDGMIRQIGTPAELYAAPSHQDVAEFMGFRNQIPARVVSGSSDDLVLDIGGSQLKGTAREKLDRPNVIVAIRPEDLMPSQDAGSGLPVVVEAVEFRGRDFFGQAKGPVGTEVFFRSETPLNPGDAIRLNAESKRVLVYPELGP